MVFFLCDGCNETLKKNKVDAHAAKCRECWSVSCVDCSQSFPGDEYRSHTSCISEAERYEKTIYRGARKLDDSGTGHRQQQHKAKKLTPQEAWQQTIEIAAESAPSSIKSYMDQLSGCDNVPRKEKQFRNFTVNSLRLKGPSAEKIKDEIWKHLSKVREDEKQKREEAQKKQQSSQQPKHAKKEAEPTSISDDDKSSNDVAKEDESPSSSSMPSENEVTKAVKKALKKAPNKSLKFKSLRKTVQETLVIKTKSDTAKKEWKKLLKQCVDANSKKLVVDGKIVSLKD
eukprot:CAMPEP_0113393926 /NCGR_PEP_ID=MMETSP0013_2-20120614/12193_1 /TAXON_ID=2843 ORGANISM="Skeletonema costatum, Strain 1716" /NCGR_SAMPLE_ID=MMETSP0013_2 /ASSEMBLY_ACC=CAM_ASM_000158 /LENGTH=285 /DNA_ID=CAMNT_0000277647 /DNA_START=24 /DNA_END=881 /DNA_ORIENTATION=- /assembly_acc=CAM_ASM_000158